MTKLPLTRLAAAMPGLMVAGFMASPANALTLLQNGQAEPAPHLLTYGLQIPAPKALTGVLPTGWQVVVDPDAGLSGTVSWSPEDTWLSVLQRLSADTGAGILVDWTSHKVLVRSEDATLQDADDRLRAAGITAPTAAPVASATEPLFAQPAAQAPADPEPKIIYAPAQVIAHATATAMSAAPVAPAATAPSVALVGSAVPTIPPAAAPLVTKASTADLPTCVNPLPDEADSNDAAGHACVLASVERTWEAGSGTTVRTTLKKWADAAGWTVVWKAERDWSIPAGFSHYGQFEAAGTWMFNQLAANGVLIRVRFYEGNRTVVVLPVVS